MRKGPKNANFKMHRKKGLKRWRRTAVGKAHLAAQARNRRGKRTEWFWTYKSTLSCFKCGFDEHPAALQFHHIDGKTKTGDVSQLLKSGSEKLARAEIAKCVVLCANCHAILHYDERKRKRASL